MLNTGYYSRLAALRQLLKQFLNISHNQQSGPTQILSLGAGFDTTWFQLQVTAYTNDYCKYLCAKMHVLEHRLNLLATQAEGISPTNYFEVDFPNVTKKKAAIIANREPLHRLLEPNLDPQNISKMHPAFAAVMLNRPTNAF